MSLPVQREARNAINADLMSHEGSWHVLLNIVTETFSAVVQKMGDSLGVKDFWASNRECSSVWDFNLGVSLELNRVIVPRIVPKGWLRLGFVSSFAVQLSIWNSDYTIAKPGLDSDIKLLARHLRGTEVVAAGGAFHSGDCRAGY